MDGANTASSGRARTRARERAQSREIGGGLMDVELAEKVERPTMRALASTVVERRLMGTRVEVTSSKR